MAVVLQLSNSRVTKYLFSQNFMFMYHSILGRVIVYRVKIMTLTKADIMATSSRCACSLPAGTVNKLFRKSRHRTTLEPYTI